MYRGPLQSSAFSQKLKKTGFFCPKWRFLEKIIVFSIGGAIFHFKKTDAVSLISLRYLKNRFFGENFHFLAKKWTIFKPGEARAPIFGIYASRGFRGCAEVPVVFTFKGLSGASMQKSINFFLHLRIFLKAVLGIFFDSKKLCIYAFRMHSLICGCMTSMVRPFPKTPIFGPYIDGKILGFPFLEYLLFSASVKMFKKMARTFTRGSIKMAGGVSHRILLSEWVLGFMSKSV